MSVTALIQMSSDMNANWTFFGQTPFCQEYMVHTWKSSATFADSVTLFRWGKQHPNEGKRRLLDMKEMT